MKPIDWFKSSHSGSSAQSVDCVETSRFADGTIGFRDSKNPDAGHHRVSPETAKRFLDAVRAGEYTL